VLVFLRDICDNEPFFVNAPLFLPPGGSFTGHLFNVAIEPQAAVGTLPGSFTIQGGTDADAFDTLASATFSVSVSVPTPFTAFTTKLELYTLMAALLLVTAAVLVRLEHSRFGLVASAIRQGDLLAETLGVNVFRYKLTAYVVGSLVAGVAGAFFAHSHQVLHSSDFGLEPMVLLVVFTVIGGTGSVWGPVVGTVLMTLAGELLRELHHYETLVFGVVLIVTMLWAPDGLVALPGKLARRRRVGVSLAP